MEQHGQPGRHLREGCMSLLFIEGFDDGQTPAPRTGTAPF
jgi:hypothetical protein